MIKVFPLSFPQFEKIYQGVGWNVTFFQQQKLNPHFLDDNNL